MPKYLLPGLVVLAAILPAAPAVAQTSTPTPFIIALSCKNVDVACSTDKLLDKSHHFVIKTVSYFCTLGITGNQIYEAYLGTTSGKVASALFLSPQNFATINNGNNTAFVQSATVSAETYADPGTNLRFYADVNMPDSFTCSIYVSGTETSP